jgi:hypothetical protein
MATVLSSDYQGIRLPGHPSGWTPIRSLMLYRGNRYVACKKTRRDLKWSSAGGLRNPLKNNLATYVLP